MPSDAEQRPDPHDLNGNRGLGPLTAPVNLKRYTTVSDDNVPHLASARPGSLS
ncbi:hypothetical protein [Actinomadura rubrisoli]|uniref:hypothetical protein n=1 Tax=Actinomadura rubrisoli TaxID=2530368 RepID=UPI00140471C3|nr:hypothetical protein [Actinomadura rubrisoli]